MEKPADLSKRYKVAYYPNGIELQLTTHAAVRIWKVKGRCNESTTMIGYIDYKGYYRECTLREFDKNNVVVQNLLRHHDGDASVLIHSKDGRRIFVPVGINERDENETLYNKVLYKLQPGDHVSKLHEYASITYLSSSKETKYTELERLFQRVDRPIFVGNRKYFDYIKIGVDCATSVTKQDVIDNKNYLVDLILEKLQNNIKFRNYGVPVTFLSIATIVLTRDKRVEFTLELKPELRKALESSCSE